MSEAAFKMVINIPVILITFMLGYYLPELSPEGVLLGTKISPEERNSSALQHIIHKYKSLYLIVCGSYSLIFTMLFYIIGKYYILLPGILFLILLMEVVQYVIYKKAQKLNIFRKWRKLDINYIILDERTQNNQALSYGWLFIPGLVIMISIITGTCLYQSVPNFLPAGIFIKNNESHWIKKSIYFIILPALLEASIVTAAYIICKMLNKLKLFSGNINTELAKQNNILFRSIWAGGIVAISTFINIIAFFTELRLLDIIDEKIFTFISILILLLIAAIIIVCIKFMKSSTDVVNVLSIKIAEKKRIASSLIDRTDDKWWILGSFYFNTQDPSPWIKNRAGRGINFNFGKPLAWLIFSVPLVIILVIILYLYMYNI